MPAAAIVPIFPTIKSTRRRFRVATTVVTAVAVATAASAAPYAVAPVAAAAAATARAAVAPRTPPAVHSPAAPRFIFQYHYYLASCFPLTPCCLCPLSFFSFCRAVTCSCRCFICRIYTTLGCTLCMLLPRTKGSGDETSSLKF